MTVARMEPVVAHAKDQLSGVLQLRAGLGGGIHSADLVHAHHFYCRRQGGRGRKMTPLLLAVRIA